MPDDVQISARVSTETRDLLEAYSRATGLKKGALIESALRHHLQALTEVPTDIVIPPRLVITRGSGERVLDMIEKAPRPTKAMRELFADRSEPRKRRGG